MIFCERTKRDVEGRKKTVAELGMEMGQWEEENR